MKWSRLLSDYGKQSETLSPAGRERSLRRLYRSRNRYRSPASDEVSDRVRSEGMGEHQERTLRIPLGGNGSEHRKIYCAIRLPDLYESNIYNPLAKTGGQIKYSSVKGVRPVSSGRLFFFCPFLKTDKLSQRTEIKLSFLGDAGRRLIQNVREGVRRVP